SGAAAERWQYLDGFGRVLRDRRQAFDGRWINVDNSYDALGRQRSTTEPYIEAATVLQTTWDAQDRPLARQLPSGAQLSYSYGARRGCAASCTSVFYFLRMPGCYPSRN
ncbi:hypothetical protein, partial [Pseudomonas aeruginosa]|uniref:hypothetical protein n=1 Tax=Pseudomonas aeruginosa TaxID=287 RepID=UPI0031B71151